jgi:hypothetical protein
MIYFEHKINIFWGNRAKTTRKTVCFDTGTPYAAERSANCGRTMKIMSIIERHQSDVIEKILGLFWLDIILFI